MKTWSAPGGNESADVVGGAPGILRATSREVNLDGSYYIAVSLSLMQQRPGDPGLLLKVETPGEDWGKAPFTSRTALRIHQKP